MGMDNAEAIKRIKDHIRVHHIGEYPHIKIAEALNLAISALATDNNVGCKWIPVTERLPEIPDGWAEHPDPVLYMMASTKTIYAGYYGENGLYRDKYFRQYHDRYEGVDADDVLCWMWQHDLPEPPKEV